MRMTYYEAAFGHTVARFLSHSFMALLGVFNVMMLVRVFKRFKTFKLAAALLVLYLGVITAICPERLVTRQNIARYETAQEIDAAYSLRLGGDAAADMCVFLQEHPQELTEDVRGAIDTRLGQHQRFRNDSWQSLNIAEQRAERELEWISKVYR